MLIVTGCQRSGTMTMASIFNLPHEVLFMPKTTQVPLIKSEVSWMAAPFLSLIKGRAQIIHLVRDPLYVINSILGIRFFDNNPQGEDHQAHKEFVYKHLPTLDQNAVAEKQALQYWLLWNELIEPHAVARIRIEDIDTKLRINQRPRANIKHWTDLPGGSLLDQVRVKAHEYGYNRV